VGWLDDNAGWIARAERWRPAHVEPLRVRLWLSSPVVYDGRDPVSLDAVLGFVVVCRETGRLPDDVFAGIGDAVVDIPVPVADVEIDGRRVACCSWARAPSCAVEALRFRRKRARVEAMASLGSHGLSGGRFKSLNIPVATLVTPWLDVYVRGDRAKIVDLARDLGGLGRDAARGLGTVLGVEVDDDPEDRSLLWRGRPQRALPLVVDGGEYDVRQLDPDGYEERDATLRAPYWHAGSMAHAVAPRAVVEAA